jgi:hypothetical protein
MLRINMHHRRIAPLHGLSGRRFCLCGLWITLLKTCLLPAETARHTGLEPAFAPEGAELREFAKITIYQYVI